MLRISQIAPIMHGLLICLHTIWMREIPSASFGNLLFAVLSVKRSIPSPGFLWVGSARLFGADTRLFPNGIGIWATATIPCPFIFFCTILIGGLFLDFIVAFRIGLKPRVNTRARTIRVSFSPSLGAVFSWLRIGQVVSARFLAFPFTPRLVLVPFTWKAYRLISHDRCSYSGGGQSRGGADTPLRLAWAV